MCTVCTGVRMRDFLFFFGGRCHLVLRGRMLSLARGVRRVVGKRSERRHFLTKNYKGNYVVTLIPGDGIGSEITASALGILQAAEVPIEFERFDDIGDELPQAMLTSVARNGVLLKGTLHTQPSLGPMSRNVLIRRAFEQTVEVVPIRSMASIKTRHKDIDIVVIREQVEGEYSGLEHETTPGVVQSLKVTTANQSEKVAKFAFQYASANGRKKVTAVHKANIMKVTDGLFLDSIRKVAKEYPETEYNEMIIDNTCMQLVTNPEQFDVMVTPNLYGNIVTNIATGLVGGPGVIPGASFGKHVAIFEPGARHVALDITGKDIANPTALILSTSIMLNYMGLKDYASKIESAIQYVYDNTLFRTPDLGGTTTTSVFTHEIIRRMQMS
ncbi:isocitrate dehydrogenase [NAD] regulatory subunit B, mitochondrial-like isoform X2 [Schistocerca gregaria]|uniref:isocitrate dehydrogenase [NAD] regulatory subunit B, mitochondrial-like isoform X2 n=1 Tax=Schistocerca gregaria TaxID=7010 RepID=UPI00211E1CE8|nr:isocitrate dehydrogenase [NAD] regulatory subunit B, mitochondrial-like isoform X2 [Schistocerca gregaria]XP_049848525.1 isocitrate dehydrogenase [NAD] regulatory subunit B, mitochondrial-like isoform X2 [Schistocerca gregaria]